MLKFASRCDRTVSGPGGAFRVPATLGAIALLFAIQGCASLTPAARPELTIDVPSAWSAGDGATSLADWWLRFNDPLLAKLVSQAMQANTSVRGAQAALLQARALRDVTAASLWPDVGASASAQHNTSGKESRGNNFRAGLDASWEADIFGANRSALAASDATAAASGANLGDVRRSIAAEVALAYIALRGAQARLAIAEANLASQLETLQITLWRQQAGLVTALEAEQQRGQTEQTRAQLPALRTSIGQTSHAVAVLTGRPPASLSVELAAAGPVPEAVDDLALGVPADALRQRPDVRAAEYQVTAALARVSQADAARLPNFKLGGSLGLNALTIGALTNSASLVTTLLASVSMPVFDGGASRAQVRAQQAALEQAGIAYQAAVLTALKEVEDALLALRGDRERLLRLRNAADAAGNAALLARQRYSSGLVDFQTVLETQRSQLSTQDSVAGATTDLGADQIRLYKALGGGWRADPGDPTSQPPATRTSRL